MHKLEYLPGPRRFIDSIGNALRDGKNVCVLAPPTTPSSIWEIVRRRHSEFGFWFDLPGLAKQESPAQQVVSLFLMSSEISQDVGPEFIIGNEKFQGKTLAVFALVRIGGVGNLLLSAIKSW